LATVASNTLSLIDGSKPALGSGFRVQGLLSRVEILGSRGLVLKVSGFELRGPGFDFRDEERRGLKGWKQVG